MSRRERIVPQAVAGAPAPGVLFVFALALAAALALPGCGRGTPASQAPPRPPRAVALVAVGTAPMPEKVAVTGVLAAQEELIVGLQVGGRLATLPVDIGDVVAADAVLAALAPRDFELEVERAQAAVVAAEARFGQPGEVDLERFDAESVPAVREAAAVVEEARLHRERVATMVQGKFQAGSELETATAALAVAENRLQRARDDVRTALAEARLRRVELQQAQKHLADSTVRAPWAGRVALRHAVAGQVLGVGDPVVTLLRVDPLRLQLRVPDRPAMTIAAGQAVEFTVDGLGDELHHGVVVRTGPAIVRGDRTRLVEAEVANPDGKLLPGAFCRAAIVTAPAVPVVVVPRSAVVSFAGVDRVFTVGAPAPPRGSGGGPAPGAPAARPAGAAPAAPEAPPAPPTNGGGSGDGAPQRLVAKGRIVQLGRAVGDAVEVVQGLQAGERIVVDAVGLSPETPVTVAE
jgi:RND family efflux transporter MFP subunit